jgi:hypothetical protein
MSCNNALSFSSHFHFGHTLWINDLDGVESLFTFSHSPLIFVRCPSTVVFSLVERVEQSRLRKKQQATRSFHINKIERRLLSKWACYGNVLTTTTWWWELFIHFLTFFQLYFNSSLLIILFFSPHNTISDEYFF